MFPEKKIDPNCLVDGKYAIKDLIDLDKLKNIFELFSRLTGYTTGLISNPDSELLITTGWRDACTKFHRAVPESSEHCKESNEFITKKLNQLEELNIKPCKNGLINSCTPIIIKGKHIANLCTGQILFNPPDFDFFKKQTEKYGFNTKAYLKAIQEIPVVSEQQLKDALSFFSKLAVMIAEESLSNLELKTIHEKLEDEIQEHKKVEIALRKNEEKYRLLIENQTDLVVMFDTEGRLKFASPSLYKMFDKTENELIGKRFFHFLHKDDIEPTRKAMEKLYEPPYFVYSEQRTRIKDDWRWIGWMNTAIHDKNNNIVSFNGIGRDITDKKQSEELEQKLRETELKSTLKSQFVANLSHEIRNPLNAIIGLLNTLQKTNLSIEQTRFLEALKASSDTLLNTLNDVLDYSKIEANKVVLNKVDFSLNELIRKIILLYENSAMEKGIKLNYKLTSAIPEFINTDINKLEQILGNLVSNAIKFTDHGHVDIKIEMTEQKNDSAQIKFMISDTGIGIRQNDFDKIFQSFSQVDTFTDKTYTGTGLGLVITKSYINLLGGTIGFDSEFSKGTTFSFQIPVRLVNKLKVSSHIKTNGNEDVQQELKKNLSVLLAEDDAFNQLYLLSFLKTQGYKVHPAKNGEEVIDLFNQFKFDIILMDCQMPKMDGFEAACIIRKKEELNNLQRTPIIVITGYDIKDIKKEYEVSDFDDYIIKPINEKHLLQKMSHCLKLHQHEFKLMN